MKYLFFLLIFLQLQSYAQVTDNVNSGSKGKLLTKLLSNSDFSIFFLQLIRVIDKMNK